MAKLLLRDRRVPRPIAALLAFAFLPIPGPIDEIVGVLALVLLAVMRPGLLRKIWHETGGES